MFPFSSSHTAFSIVSSASADSDTNSRAEPTAILYARPLRTGGFVAIEAQQPPGETYHAAVVVERRSDPARRHGHSPPVIAAFAGPTRLSVMQELYQLAADDELLARGIASMERDRPVS